MMQKPVIVAEKLVKHFDHFVAVDHIDFEIFEGECFGFLGPNGAGKTSTMKMIYCFSPKSAGMLKVLDMDVASQSKEIKRQIGVVPQENSLDPDLSVAQNLLVYGNYFDLPLEQCKSRAAELLHFFQLEEKREATIKNLSGGMQRRLVLARALINQPRVLILDEPTTALDPQARHAMWAKLRALKKSGVTMVLTTHYMEEAAELCDRLVIMDHGKILATGSPAELVQKYVGKEVYEIRAAKESLILLEHLFRQNGLEAECIDETLYAFMPEGRKPSQEATAAMQKLDVRHRMASLEDVFLKVAGRELRD